MDNQYKSLNLETGMLEDIDEVREVGVAVADMLRTVLQHPLIQMIAPPDVLRETAGIAVKAESMLRPMSQREQYRLLSQATGVPPAIADMIESEVGGLSYTLPGTHPQVRDRLLRSILDNPFFPESTKQEAIRVYQEDNASTEKIELPPGIEGFLGELGEDKKGE